MVLSDLLLEHSVFLSQSPLIRSMIPTPFRGEYKIRPYGVAIPSNQLNDSYFDTRRGEACLRPGRFMKSQSLLIRSMIPTDKAHHL